MGGPIGQQFVTRSQSSKSVDQSTHQFRYFIKKVYALPTAQHEEEIGREQRRRAGEAVREATALREEVERLKETRTVSAYTTVACGLPHTFLFYVSFLLFVRLRTVAQGLYKDGPIAGGIGLKLALCVTLT